MGTNILLHGHKLPTSSLPLRVDALTRCVGMVNHPGKATRFYLASGITMTDLDRKTACHLLSTYREIVDHRAPLGEMPADEAKLAIVTKLQMGLAMGQVSEAGMEARFDLFDVALEDVPAWAVAAAARRWARKECPKDVDPRPNYAFAPSAAVLRDIAMREVEPYRASIESLERLLAAGSIEDAMSLDKDEPPKIEHRAIKFALPKM